MPSVVTPGLLSILKVKEKAIPFSNFWLGLEIYTWILYGH